MKILGCIGEGSFGKVYKVSIQNDIYAIKKINLGFFADEESAQLKDAKNQAKLLSNCLYHPNIVRFYKGFKLGDYYYIAMEYVGRKTLADHQLPLQEKQIVNYIIQIVLGLKHLQNHNIIHRDIKPSNILISDKGLLKISDFGISKQIQFNQKAQSCLGTPYYTAPEIIKEQKYDYSVDVWSFGVVLYELCHGFLPFLANNMTELKRKIRQDMPYIKDNLHKDLKLIIRGCLSKDPQYRFSLMKILQLPLIKQQMNEELKKTQKYF